MPSILFVCTANCYRSPIAAAAFLRKAKEANLGDQWVVGSAGTWTTPGLPPIEAAVRTAGALGLDIAGHMSTPISQKDFEEYDLVLVMEAGHKEAILNEFSQSRGRVFLLTEVAANIAYDIPDPMQFEESEESDKIAAEICNLLDVGFENIIRLASNLRQVDEPASNETLPGAGT